MWYSAAFLTGTLQNFARKKRMAIDSVSFDYQEMDRLSQNTNLTAGQLLL